MYRALYFVRMLPCFGERWSPPPEHGSLSAESSLHRDAAGSCSCSGEETGTIAAPFLVFVGFDVDKRESRVFVSSPRIHGRRLWWSDPTFEASFACGPTRSKPDGSVGMKGNPV